MNRKNLPKYLRDFAKSIDYAIKECSRKTGITDVESVQQFMKTSASIQRKRLKLLIFDKWERIIIQKRLKRCTVSARKAAEQALQDALQMEFDFFEMEQFRGVAQRITYPEGKEMKYVEYNRSLEWQRILSITHLDWGIAADVIRRDREIAANQFLQPLVKKYGDLPAEELVHLWLLNQRGGTVNGGVE